MRHKGLTAAAAAAALAVCGAGSAVGAQQYVLMNIPYSDFYRAELTKNTVPVDAVTSATVAKAENVKLVGGSYHTAEGKALVIGGVTFPVKAEDTDLKSFAHAASPDELFAMGSYTWTDLAEIPSCYKEMRLSDGAPLFGKIHGLPEVKVANIKGNIQTMTRRGDYQLKLEGFDVDTEKETLYGVIVRTDKKDYGMRRLENIWRGGRELGWNVGYTKFIKDVNPTFPAHYRTLTGTTITELTYITDKALYTMDVEIYLPVLTGCRLKAENAAVKAGTTAFSVMGQLPDDYLPQYDVSAFDGAVKEGRVVWPDQIMPGEYDMKIHDKNGIYETLKTTFVLSTDALPVAYDTASGRLVPSGSEKDFKNYLRCIAMLTIDGKTINPRKLKILNGQGQFDLSAPLFKENSMVTVKAAGYPDLTFEASRR